MKRRSFLGFLGGAAVSAPTLAKAASDNAALRQAGFPMGAEVCGAAPVMPAYANAGAVSKFVRWIKRTGIPDWKMSQLEQRAEYFRRYGLDPDLACLVSVSAGFKARSQRRRNLERVIDQSLGSVGMNGKRNAFYNKVRDRFGDDIDWYD